MQFALCMYIHVHVYYMYLGHYNNIMIKASCFRFTYMYQ